MEALVAVNGKEDIKQTNANTCSNEKAQHQPSQQSTPTTQQRVSGRHIKRPRKDGDTSSPKVFAGRRLQQDIAASSPKSSNPERTRRSWDLWTPESKDWFFDALCEFGKDFDAIYNSMAAKSRKSKTQQGEMTFKNKDQVRYFYYRTWHKVSKALGDLGDMKKSVQELYGLINYSEMRKKIGFKALNPTNAPRLLELVITGQTIIKVKGKNFRVKTPVCRALRLINNVPDKGWEGPKIPPQITIELRPIDNAAWTHVQSLAQNPRVRVTCLPQRKVASIVELMEGRWQPGHMKKKNSLLAALEGLETPQELKNSIFQFAAPQKLRLRVFPNQQPKAIEFLLADTYCSTDVCLNSYRIRFAKRDEGSTVKSATGVTATVDPKMPEMRSDSHSVETSGSNDSHKAPIEGKDEKAIPAGNTNAGTSMNTSNKQTTNCDNNFNPHLITTTHLNSGKKDVRERKLSLFSGPERTTDRSVSALVNEEANDGLASNLVCATTTNHSIPANDDKVKVDKDGPVGEGWTADSLSVLTVGDLYLRLGCPTSIILYYKFEGADFPAPENRIRNVMDKLITVLLASFCDKKSTLAQPKPQAAAVTAPKLKPHPPAAVATGPTVSPLPPKPKRERLLERAARDLPNEFAVPQGHAPRAFKKNSITLDSIRVELPSGNKRQRARRKPIQAMVLQRPLLPRTSPVVQGTVTPGVGGAPQSVPSGVVVRNILPAAPVPSEMETSLDKIISTSIVGEISLERIIASTITSDQPSPLPDIVPDVPVPSTGSENIQLNHSLQIPDAAGSDLRLSIPSLSSDTLETPKKAPFNLNELDQGPSMSLDFSPLLSTPNKQWFNGEGSNLSLGSLLNSFESPLKATPLPTGPPDSNSNLESRLPDVESHLQSLMNESSLDYASKFADLAAQIARQTTAGTGTSADS
ncbi:protein cramped-like [Varroa jacobsoni]|uniref:protein cramped-like n=1 Tax=Varroa jacobsoni TaxID=62625 RepID=UPI000BFA0296|nr:protein cramped-like [Varroa jacobsoni]